MYPYHLRKRGERKGGAYSRGVTYLIYSLGLGAYLGESVY